MRIFGAAISVLALISINNGALAEPQCDRSKALGVSRTIEIDNTASPRYGLHQYKQTIDLAAGEIVLTFDDGPHPLYTKAVLSALERHCTKATFFAVGTMALTYPDIVRLVAKSGHTIGAHTYRHTNLRHVGFERAKRAIERGFAAVQEANQQPVAPFFRFPYLSTTSKLQKYLGSRGIAILSVDINSGDTGSWSTKAIIRRTMRLLKKKGKGIILLHDLRSHTALLLPDLLNTLKAGGYKVVHIVPRTMVDQVPTSAQHFVAQIIKQKDVVHRARKTGARDWRKRRVRRRYRQRRYRQRDWVIDRQFWFAFTGS